MSKIDFPKQPHANGKAISDDKVMNVLSSTHCPGTLSCGTLPPGSNPDSTADIVMGPLSNGNIFLDKYFDKRFPTYTAIHGPGHIVLNTLSSAHTSSYIHSYTLS